MFQISVDVTRTNLQVKTSQYAAYEQKENCLLLTDNYSLPDSLRRNWNQAEILPFPSLTDAHLSSTVMMTKLSFLYLQTGNGFPGETEIKIALNKNNLLFTLSTVQ